MLRKFFMRLKAGTEHLNYGRDIVKRWGADFIIKKAERGDQKSFQILDLGCGHGTDLLNIKKEVAAVRLTGKRLNLHLSGIENYPLYIKECRKAGIKIHSVDIEGAKFPTRGNFFDLVIANQILEHTKEIFWIAAETARVLRPGGRLIVGVPNLAALHNRILLLFGQQPTAQQTLSAHVRGFTRPDFKKFIECGDFFRLLDFKGSNFYPFGETLSRPLSSLFPSFAWGIFFLLERTNKKGSFLDCLIGDKNLVETPFFGSPQNPA